MRLTWGVVAAAAVVAAGCKPDGPPTYRLVGTVRLAGKPVPMGKIYFDPVGQAGMPSGYTAITDGRFDTGDKDGRKVVGGKMSVRIQGNAKDGVDAISGFGPPLFREYTTIVELPRQDSTMDFDVPASAAKDMPTIVPLDLPANPANAGKS